MNQRTHARRLIASMLLLLLCAISLLWPTSPRSSAPTRQACLLLSPNTQNDLDIGTARQRLDSVEHRRYNRLASDILSELGVTGHRVHDALGEWEGQVENSLFVSVDRPTNPKTLACAAAWFGLAAKQKAVLAFHADDEGDHVLADVDLPGRSLDEVRTLLDRHQMPARTLLPRPNGWQAIVLAPAHRSAQLRRLPATVRLQTGNAVFLEGATTDGARQRYQEVIRLYHTTHKTPPLAKLGL